MKILYAEDEKGLSMAVTEILKIEGFEVDNAYDGEESLYKVSKNYYDICILDVMMPKMQGTDVVKKMREKGIYTPVIMLTAKTTTEDRVEGLSVGADDYLCKPFETQELIARINSLVRRTSAQYHNKSYKFANIAFDTETKEVKTDTSSLVLGAKEADLLELFLQNPNAEFTKEEIKEKITGDMSDTGVELYVNYIITKLKTIGAFAYIDKNTDTYKLVEVG